MPIRNVRLTIQVYGMCVHGAHVCVHGTHVCVRVCTYAIIHVRYVCMCVGGGGWWFSSRGT